MNKKKMKINFFMLLAKYYETAWSFDDQPCQLVEDDDKYKFYIGLCN